MAHLTVTAAIARLRELHDAGYDLVPLLKVAQEHDPKISSTCGSAEAVAHRYLATLAAEAGAPSLDAFQDAWPHTATDNAERVAFAWRALTPADRKAAVECISTFMAARQAAGFGPISGALYLNGKKWRDLK